MSFACKKLCGYTKMKRPHFSCMFCRVRRLFYGKMDKKRYHYNRKMRIVMPQDCTTYVIFIDNKRRFANVKAAILKRLLAICEWLAN
jgi:hypothetical protein